jgi:hypothetical protein
VHRSRPLFPETIAAVMHSRSYGLQRGLRMPQGYLDLVRARCSGARRSRQSSSSTSAPGRRKSPARRSSRLLFGTGTNGREPPREHRDQYGQVLEPGQARAEDERRRLRGGLQDLSTARLAAKAALGACAICRAGAERGTSLPVGGVLGDNDSGVGAVRPPIAEGRKRGASGF